VKKGGLGFRKLLRMNLPNLHGFNAGPDVEPDRLIFTLAVHDIYEFGLES
jgi:hypothetical protein